MEAEAEETPGGGVSKKLGAPPDWNPGGAREPRPAGGGELHHEGGQESAESRPDGARGRGEVRREGQTRHVGVAGGINCDGVPTVGRESAEVGGVDQRRAVAVELRHEGVATAAKG